MGLAPLGSADAAVGRTACPTVRCSQPTIGFIFMASQNRMMTLTARRQSTDGWNLPGPCHGGRCYRFLPDYRHQKRVAVSLTRSIPVLRRMFQNGHNGSLAKPEVRM